MKIAIVGYDVEGQASYRYFSRDPADEFMIFDEAETPRAAVPAGVRVVTGPHALEMLPAMEFDMVIRTPGLSPHKLDGVSGVTTATQEFFHRCPAPIIGVTGTKGKGTTASLIHAILTAGGRKCWLVGNIGTPSLDVLDDISENDVVVYELSSFQLWDVDTSPHVAVVLMIEPDHLDVHEDMQEYIMAKSNIGRNQTPEDVMVYNVRNPFSQQIAEQSQARKISYGNPGDVTVKDGSFYHNEQSICSTSPLKIRGNHNLDNACAAIAATREYVTDPSAIERGLASFDGLPHRLKFVREVGGVSYYDDSIATTPGSAIAALRAFDRPKVIILGGSDKGNEYHELERELATANVRGVVAIGNLSEEMANMAEAAGVENVSRLGMTNMERAVQVARELAEIGDIVILSPAAASFDMFKSYADRGDQFVKEVNAL